MISHFSNHYGQWSVNRHTNTNSSAIFDPDFKRTGGDGGNEVTLPQHVWTDSSCSSNALCPLGESRACQQDGYIKKKLQKRKKKGSDSKLIFKRPFLKKKKKKKLLYNRLKEQWCVSKGMISWGGEQQQQNWHQRPRRRRLPRLGQWGANRGRRGRGWGTQGGRDGVWSTDHHVASILEELVLPRW